MIKLFKHLKSKAWAIIFIVMLLITQAVSDLTLPEYTSKIVNIGIQQSGIEDTFYKEITTDSMNDFFVLSNNEEKELLNKHYKEFDNKYVLDNEEEIIKELTKTKTILKLITTENLKEFDLTVSNIKTKHNIDDITIFEYLKENNDLNIIKELEKQIKELPDSFTHSLIIESIKNEYTNLNVDLSKMQTDYVLKSGLKMLGIALISMIATLLVGLIGSIISASFARDIRSKLYNKTIEFSSTEMKQIGISSLITRTTNDVEQIQRIMVFMLRIMFYAPIIGIGGVIKAIAVNKEMATIILFVLVIAIIIGIITVIFAIPKIKIIQKLVDKLNKVSREMLNGILVIRAFGNQEFQEDKFKSTSGEIKKNYTFVNSFFSILNPVLTLIMNAIAIVIVYRAAHLIDQGVIQVGDMLAFIQYVMQIVMSFVMISIFAIRIPRASVSAKRINEVLNMENTIKDPKKPKSYSKRLQGQIEFKNVSFQYFDSDENVLSDITFKVEKGETVAIIGSTGSGKSTLISLIPRLFDVTKGEVLVNGLNVKDVKKVDLYDKISFIFQKGTLFSGSIKDNIDYSDKNLSDKELALSAEISQSKEFIEKRKGKYESFISQGATNVSGGQKQRLSIARALAKDSDIYIFDDSFSALDFTTDQKLRKALKDNLQDKTILIVSQRVATIMDADKIIVLDEGRLVGEGTHKELIKTNTIYKEIALSQLSEKELK